MKIAVSPLQQRVSSIHFIGIGGAGMGGIAEVLLRQGFTVTGSDLGENRMTRRLLELGATIFRGHAAENIAGANVIVVSSAIPETNPEIVAARDARIPIIPRAQMLAELMRFRHGIAVAGTHGKTTTTSLIAAVMTEGDLDPTFVIGGQLNSAGCNSYLGESPYLVAEADESDASFLHLHPMMAVVTNIDAEHMQTYGGSFAKLKKAFREFLGHLPFYGRAVLCIDNQAVRSLLKKVHCPVITYGFNKEADVRAVDFEQVGMQCQFTVVFGREKRDPMPVTLNLAGRHNVQNALAAIAVGLEVGIEPRIICRALENFAGVGRRLQKLGEYPLTDGKALVMDDYGHHPREVEATLTALRQAWPEKRIAMIYQPHRYSRTQDLFDEFARVLAQVDELILLDIYAASEAPIEGVSSQSLAAAIKEQGMSQAHYLPDQDALASTLQSVLKKDDVLLFQGAGDIGQLAQQLAKQCQ